MQGTTGNPFSNKFLHIPFVHGGFGNLLFGDSNVHGVPIGNGSQVVDGADDMVGE